MGFNLKSMVLETSRESVWVILNIRSERTLRLQGHSLIAGYLHQGQ
jgi:hypothetical protein